MTKDRARAKAQLISEWAVKAEKKATEIQNEFDAHPFANDFGFWSEPIKIGHHSETKHRNLRARLMNKLEQNRNLLKKAEEHRSKAANLLNFANRNKGDADKKKQEERMAIDKKISLGIRIYSMYGLATITKINKITVQITRDDGRSITLDKRWIAIL